MMEVLQWGDERESDGEVGYGEEEDGSWVG